MAERKIKVDLRLFMSCQHSLESRLSEETNEECKSDIIKSHLDHVTTEFESVVPEFDNDFRWLNTSRPLKLRDDLAGRIVVLDFFTYCCINCIHILPTLEELEAKYAEKGVVVVGVHSAKFENEKVIENVISAVLRYGIRHPVINDSKGQMWDSLAICCWPTLVVLGPDNQVLFVLMGEGNGDLLFRFIEVSLAYFGDRITTKQDLPMKLLSSTLAESPLRFPGKIASCPFDSDIVAIADSGHNRILVVLLNGLVKVKVGGGEPGFADGSFDEARFRSPQGLAWASVNIIYVADTENHAIREVNLSTRTVRTAVGTGQQGNDLTGGKTGLEQAISSPWDLCVSKTGGHLLLIAMAGSHQIWGHAFDGEVILADKSKIEKKICKRLVGSGKEENRNNRYPHRAAFAQPSGVCLTTGDDLACLIVADSESSAIRSVNLITWGVQAVLGGGIDPMDLFNFGDKDGSGMNAKLQHPLGVCYSVTRDLVYVADSYNHKIKRVNVQSRTCETLQLTGDVKFDEPGGLCISNDEQSLYVADTNNHCIKVIDLVDNSAKKLPIRFVEDVTVSSTNDVTDTVKNDCGKCERHKPHLTVLAKRFGCAKSTTKSTFFLVVRNAEELTLNTSAPNSWRLFLPEGNFRVNRASGTIKVAGDRLELFNLTVPSAIPSVEPMELETTLYVCDTLGMCHVRTVLFLIPFDVETEQLSEYMLQFTLKL